MHSRNGHPLDGLRGRFAAWRQERTKGSLIPEPLWGAAVQAALEHGVWQTSKHLRVDYYSLKKRVERGHSKAAPGGPVEFVEIPGKVLSPGPGCVLEIEDRKGVRLRVELRDAAGAEGLARSLWRGRR